MKRISQLVCLVALVGLTCGPIACFGKEPLISLQQWSVNEDVHLKVEVNAKSATESVFSVLKNGKSIYKMDPGALYVVSVFPLDDGNLATIWAPGIGNEHHLFVFTYSKNNVRLVLHTVSSGLIPEFVYQSQGRIMRNPNEPNGPYLQQRIVNPNTDWVVPTTKQKSELLPVSADIYIWDDKRKAYKVIKKVPWFKRFQLL